jgi:hypothetical protein
VFLGCGLLLPPLFFPVAVVGLLLIGWTMFLYRVIPAMTVDWAGLATALLCLTALAVGLHYICGWIHQQIVRAKYPDQIETARWRPRWTFALLALVVLMFVAGIAAVGMTHQSYWLATAPEPLTESSFGVRVGRTQSRNNLKQVGLGVQFYDQAFRQLPPGVIFDSQGRALHGWQTLILPFIEENNVFKQIKHELPWSHADNRLAFQTMIPEYLNPNARENTSPDGYGLSHYAGNVHVLGTNAPLRIATDFPSGTSKTILAGEARGNFGPWGHPTSWRDPGLGINKSPDGFGNPGDEVSASLLMVDGSVRTVMASISPEVLKALAMPSGGSKIPDDWDE